MMASVLRGRAVVSYFADLFRVEKGGEAFAFLPYLITAVAVGVILAAVCFTILRAREAAFLRRLAESGADAPDTAKTLSELGYIPGTFRYRRLLRRLSDPTGIFYRNASSDALDRLKAQFAASDAEGGTPAVTSDASAATDGMSDAANDTAATGDSEEPTKKSGDAQEPGTPHGKARRQKKQGFRLAVDDATRFYIPAERRSYVETRALKFSTDDYMGLVYTSVAAALLWFLLLNVLDPLLGLFVK